MMTCEIIKRGGAIYMLQGKVRIRTCLEEKGVGLARARNKDVVQ